MRNVMILILIAVLFTGCSGAFWSGGGVGALGAGAGYEINLERQMRRIDDDLNAGSITQEEYDIRKNQIERDSLIK
ncbi:hypothetical protein ACFL3D_05605 [Candidatus Omnitrophota bacterium]